MSTAYNIIDVSEFQGNIDWNKVKESGTDGAIIKFGAGPKIVDSKFDYNVRECIRLGLHVGAYIYSWATTEAEAKAEADRLIDACAKYDLDMPLYYDIEEGTINKRTATAQLTTEAFLNRCKERGIIAGVYSGLYWWIHYLYPSRILEHPLWIAQYNGDLKRPQHSHPEWFGMFQYTSKGKVPGINGNVDMNYCYVPYWEKYGKKIDSQILDFTKLDGELVQLSMHLANANKAYQEISKQVDILKSENKLKSKSDNNQNEQPKTAPEPEKVPEQPESPKPQSPTPTPQQNSLLSISFQQLFLKTYFYYYKGNIDGQRGPQTIAATKAYQAGQSLGADGIWGPKTDNASKANARAVQQKLTDAGFKTTVDGIIGNGTIESIKQYQKSVGLTVDGIMGNNTYRKLFNISAPAQSSLSVPNGYVSPHFRLTEFRCGCGGRYCNGYNYTSPNQKLINILERIRSYFGRPIVITSGIRCQRYNDSLRGSIKKSAHISGKAVDIYIAGITNTASGKALVKKLAYQYGAAYCYYGTPNMGNAVHINV